MTRSSFVGQLKTFVSKIGNTNHTLSVRSFPDEVPINKFGNLQI